MTTIQSIEADLDDLIESLPKRVSETPSDILKSFLREKLLSILDEVVMEEKVELDDESVGTWNQCRAELLSRIDKIKGI